MALALTDHDTVDALADFKKAGEENNLTTIGGIEMSLLHPDGTMHLLGYQFGAGPLLREDLELLRANRLERNLQILAKLQALGYPLTWDYLLKLAPGGQVGRPHFAEALIQLGCFTTYKKVFTTLLKRGRPAYVPKKGPSPREGLAMLTRAGWVPVLAHPVTLEIEPAKWFPLLADLKTHGLVGLEVYHPRHDPDDVAFFKSLAQKVGLVMTAGSDFHGASKPHISLDWVRKNSDVPWRVLADLQKK